MKAKGKMTKMKAGGVKKRVPKAKDGIKVPKAYSDTAGQQTLRSWNAALGLRDSDQVVKAKEAVAREKAKVEAKKKAMQKKGGTTKYKKGGTTKRK